ncbi:hypothetical protein T03_17288 [Trichinella britovi]|uniref:Uncharacterized protein n=1 Tax=Trichinella britovi TaxID=45882 RepID=A0A0V1APZ4_TRIBR|nr:hypothetical protein T03_17288 [Trichinella britovi]
MSLHIAAFFAADGTHCVSYGSDVLPYHASFQEGFYAAVIRLQLLSIIWL